MTLLVKSNTNKGFEEANEGDSINFSNPSSSPRRGRVGKGVAQTLDTQSNQAVVIQINESTESGGKQPYQQNRVYDTIGISPTLMKDKNDLLIGTLRTHKDGQGFREVDNGISPTIPARAREDGSGQPIIENSTGIRRLTEIECERLQGFPDDWTRLGDYNGSVKEIPRTQRYKLIGNAVTVDVVEAIANRLKEF